LSPRHPKSRWNAERIAHLRARWAQGVSAARIGRELGISRCAVLGKLHRLGSAHLSPAARGRRASGTRLGHYSGSTRRLHRADIAIGLGGVGAR
jgi:GcrA cell cycle regulator